jgi:hypothetical protein
MDVHDRRDIIFHTPSGDGSLPVPTEAVSYVYVSQIEISFLTFHGESLDHGRYMAKPSPEWPPSV